ncbi:hypothetical protein DFS34DRAFT_595825 [Phlyctochytrium arcticum]|nr:hypothetical protein DFS34DRAFT_595825 [Phlyctochytrium arcticum]
MAQIAPMQICMASDASITSHETLLGQSEPSSPTGNGKHHSEGKSTRAIQSESALASPAAEPSAIHDPVRETHELECIEKQSDSYLPSPVASQGGENSSPTDCPATLHSEQTFESTGGVLSSTGGVLSPREEQHEQQQVPDSGTRQRSSRRKQQRNLPAPLEHLPGTANPLYQPQEHSQHQVYPSIFHLNSAPPGAVYYSRSLGGPNIVYVDVASVRGASQSAGDPDMIDGGWRYGRVAHPGDGSPTFIVSPTGASPYPEFLQGYSLAQPGGPTSLGPGYGAFMVPHHVKSPLSSQTTSPMPPPGSSVAPGPNSAGMPAGIWGTQADSPGAAGVGMAFTSSFVPMHSWDLPDYSHFSRHGPRQHEEASHQQQHRHDVKSQPPHQRNHDRLSVPVHHVQPPQYFYYPQYATPPNSGAFSVSGLAPQPILIYPAHPANHQQSGFQAGYPFQVINTASYYAGDSSYPPVPHVHPSDSRPAVSAVQPESPIENIPVCRYYQQGRCWAGGNCRFSHHVGLGPYIAAYPTSTGGTAFSAHPGPYGSTSNPKLSQTTRRQASDGPLVVGEDDNDAERPPVDNPRSTSPIKDGKCRYYTQGRCWAGLHCRFSHD